MATVKQYKYNWRNPITGNIENKNETGTFDLEGRIVKAGIQAPPGTKFNITFNNDGASTEIIIGKNGILELEYEGVLITQISLKRQPIYSKNYEAMNSVTTKALSDINQAINSYETVDEKNLETVQNLAISIVNGYNSYYTAVQGIYTNINTYKDVENVIIDYIEED